MKRKIKDDFNIMAMLLIPVGVAINIVGFQIASVLKLPIFLDTIGTILIGVIAGPWVAVLAGLVTNLINGIFNPVWFPYAIVSIAIGFVTGLLTRKGMFQNIPKALISAVIITFITIITSAPITVLVYGGATGNTSALITATFLAAGQQIWSAVFSSTIITEVGDKIISVMIVYFIVRLMSDRYLSKLNYGHLYMKRKK
ncbi:ECF transporter S component [Radiobacillus deserti]|uniref:ECF transporter S component n=1 Tax=Radiobacillus deserti TaxID=2594883 RepID=A0A516KIZ9_9BACI|nr:ECF transporter S component [Radiobacillus deserti]QDP41378.1 ECF transporter S component [Radiobacillus deserti]